MRILETHLKESQFLSRVETLCKKRQGFQKGMQTKMHSFT